MAKLTTSTKAVTKHKAERSFQHRFIGLLKTGFLVEGENFAGRSELLVSSSRGSDRFAPSQRRAALAFSCGPMSETRLLRQTFSRKASFRARRESNSRRV